MEHLNTIFKICDMKKILHILLDELNKRGDTDTIQFKDDLYWNILDEERYDSYQEPSNMTMGSLIEDWGFLQKVIKQEREIIDYDLYKLASILKFLGKEQIITNFKPS